MVVHSPENILQNQKPQQVCLQQVLLQEFFKEELNENNNNNANNIYLNFFGSEILHKITQEACQDCLKMSSLPQGALFVRKIRERDEFDHANLLAHMKAVNEQNDMKNLVQEKKLLDYNPVKYNEKLMKSIWGQYNRYSPHNIKTNVHEKELQAQTLQQQIAVAGSAIAKTFAMAIHSTQEWTFGKH